MKIYKPEAGCVSVRHLFTMRGLFRLVFAIGGALVVAGTAMLAAAFSGLIQEPTALQVVATATLVTGGGTLVSAGMIFSSIDEREAARSPEPPDPRTRTSYS